MKYWFDDITFHRHLAWSILLLAPVVLMVLLWFQPSTYGKLSSPNRNYFGPMISAKWSWILFESPNWMLASICYARRNEELDLPNILLVGWFVFHYLHRSIVYPLKLSSQSKFPIGIMLLAAPYCIVNGYLQAQDLVRFQQFPRDHTSSIQFLCGVAFMLAGFGITYHADSALTGLKTSTGTYQIPSGFFLFDYVSCPHYLGEIIEWTGFCMAANGSWASLSFVVWTSCNLIPRALAQHEWYHATFSEEYKKLERTAIVPYIL